MKNELTRRIFLACMIVFLLSLSLMLYVLDRTLAERNLSGLRDRAIQAAWLLNEKGMTAAEQFPKDARTVIAAPDGSILYSSIPGAEGNLSDRVEIQEALAAGEGSCERYSSTMKKNTAYYAIRLENGNILRISITQDTVWTMLLDMLNPMLLIVLVAVVMSIVLASRFSGKIMQPIDRLDVENPDDRDVYDEMKPFLRRLMKQNQQIYRQMEALQEEHRKQDSMRRELTANVSHELKTPLTSISGFAEIMRDGMVQEKDIPHFADNIYKEAQRLITLVNDILKLSRLEDTDSPAPERTEVALLGLCQDIAARLALPAAKNSITISCEGEEATVSGVERMLEDIIFNVCDNAIKYNQPGGSVQITVGTEEGKAFVCVKDSGIGIPVPEQERVFERFYRVDMSHSKEVGGTGLGLSIVKHGMALHDGEIRLDSTPGKGTEITLLFP